MSSRYDITRRAETSARKSTEQGEGFIQLFDSAHEDSYSETCTFAELALSVKKKEGEYSSRLEEIGDPMKAMGLMKRISTGKDCQLIMHTIT